MSTFDPAEVRTAVAQFTPRRPQKFHDLVPAKEVIVELRQKGGSYRSIAELLTQHCLPTSKTAIAVFCHQVLGENVRPRKRSVRKRPPVPVPPNGGDTASNPIAVPAATALPDPSANSNGDEVSPVRTRGPRIAQVRMLKPQTT